MVDLEALFADLGAEGDDLDALVADLPDEKWRTPTPAKGWTIAHQIAHLAGTDSTALTSITDAAAFAKLAERGRHDPHRVDRTAAAGLDVPPPTLLSRWRAGRARLLEALRATPSDRRLDWFGPPMSVASMATARLMETWAHGQDVADALGVTRAPTARLQHVAHLGVLTRDYAYRLRNQTPPSAAFRVELVAPDGQLWTWGPEDAAQRVRGPALDFCLRVTQRRRLDQLALEADGPDVTYWLGIAQAFAGVPQGAKPGGVSGTGSPPA
jgi:uncharacterized protein (TIGR03084 family)